MNPQAYIMKLICHAPAIPEWFKPIGKFPWDRRLTEDEQLEKRFFEWPFYYAKQVMEAAGIKDGGYPRVIPFEIKMFEQKDFSGGNSELMVKS